MIQHSTRSLYELPLGGRPDTTLEYYLQAIGHVPLLSAEEEVQLAQDIEQGGQIGQAARTRLIEANQRLVVSIAKRYQWSGMELMDLIQEGNIGLITAVDRFDWRRGCRFSSSATWWQSASIGRAIANTSRTIRLPLYIQTTLHRIWRMRERLSYELGREPSLLELAEATELDPVQLMELQHVAHVPLSLERPLDAQTEVALGDTVPDPASVPLEETAVAQVFASEVDHVLSSSLSPREHLVVQKRFGLLDEQAHRLAEVGQVLGVTRERVRQIEQRALAKLRQSSAVTILRQ